MSIQFNTTQEDAAQFLTAETEADVTAALSDGRLEAAVWKPLGGIENNYGIVENQQADPMAALTELIVNSIDAILLKNYHEYVGDEYTGDEFGTLDAAADTLIDPDIEEIRLAADGTGEKSLSLTLSDTGCGQLPERFEETFLGFLQPGKTKQQYGFLQGKYGMGSSGVLPFCGERGYNWSSLHASIAPRSGVGRSFEKQDEGSLRVSHARWRRTDVLGDGKRSGTGSIVKLFEFTVRRKHGSRHRFATDSNGISSKRPSRSHSRIREARPAGHDDDKWVVRHARPVQRVSRV